MSGARRIIALAALAALPVLAGCSPVGMAAEATYEIVTLPIDILF